MEIEITMNKGQDLKVKISAVGSDETKFLDGYSYNSFINECHRWCHPAGIERIDENLTRLSDTCYHLTRQNMPDAQQALVSAFAVKLTNDITKLQDDLISLPDTKQ